MYKSNLIGIAAMYAGISALAHAGSKRERIIGYYDPADKSTISRNDRCLCGSGLKFKKCCLGKEIKGNG